jgi:hypothetical protein
MDKKRAKSKRAGKERRKGTEKGRKIRAKREKAKG